MPSTAPVDDYKASSTWPYKGSIHLIDLYGALLYLYMPLISYIYIDFFSDGLCMDPTEKNPCGMPY